ncbi:MAG: DUF3341 domain-containing protein [Rhodothermales bacterium]|nr:DUF3341 domain-containing protein [Rhodothermales bacterium]MBO6779163.1 DUF3341 domain-containing protein [Rhodothermales bacterium]
MNPVKELIRDVKASMGIFESPNPELHGLLAEFPNPGALYHAAEGVRDAGYKHFDAHSPFPIHGMDDAMGLGNSLVGWITFGGGIAGLALGTWLQWWTGAVDYPLNISGKPFFAVEPSIPVMFELTILLSALSTVAGMFALNGLPRPYNPLFYSSNFARATDDAFFLHIAATDRRFEKDGTRRLLEDLGATTIEVIRDRGDSDLED